jgi:ubiquinone/menaquinone biosynthesis C-methylase UbiE
MQQPAQSEDEKHQVCEIFEQWAPHYATERERTPYFRAQVAIVSSMLAGKSGRILDLGCAAGGEIPELRTHDFSVVGVDISSHMLKFARQRFASDPNVQFCRADIDRLPFLSQSMNHVVCLGVFEFLPDYNAAVQEIHRVLRPGGLAIFAIPSRISQCELGERLASVSVAPLWRTAKRLVRRTSTPAQVKVPFHRNLCVPWRFRTLLRGHGFELQQDHYSTFFVFPLNRFPPLDARVAAALEPLCSIPVLRCLASVYLVSARKL